MLLWLPLVFLSAGWAAPAIVEYSAPYSGDQPDVLDYRFTQFIPGDTAWIARPGVQLWPEERADDQGVPIRAGSTIEILGAASAPIRRADRVDQMYRVQAGDLQGWVFGGDLTPLRFAADLDQDGEVEDVTVSFSADFRIEVRAFEPTLGDEHWVLAMVQPAGGAYLAQRGATVRAEVIDTTQAGVPLVHVSTGVEACADYAELWMLYRSSGPGVAGTLSTALELSGLVDPPNCSTFEVNFRPRRLRAVVTRTNGCGDDPSEPTTQSRERFRLRDGRYQTRKSAAPSRDSGEGSGGSDETGGYSTGASSTAEGSGEANAATVPTTSKTPWTEQELRALESWIGGIYAAYREPGGETPAAIEAWPNLSDALRAALTTFASARSPDELGNPSLGFDPVVMAQDAAVSEVTTDPGFDDKRSWIDVHFSSFGTPATVRWWVVREQGTWKVDNLSGGGKNQDLRRELAGG